MGVKSPLDRLDQARDAGCPKLVCGASSNLTEIQHATDGSYQIGGDKSIV